MRGVSERTVQRHWEKARIYLHRTIRDGQRLTNRCPSSADDRWQRLSPHLDRALELSGEERAAWLASPAREDPALAADLETLLEEHDALSEKGFSRRRSAPAAAGVAGRPDARRLHAGLADRARAAWAASGWPARSDGRFEGHAAVKLLNASAGRPRRRGALPARGQHPRAAHPPAHRAPDRRGRVAARASRISCSSTSTASPSTATATTRRLDVEARLRLFLDVLAAVAHAHANLIVHRDIKPSNVLVGDGRPGEAARLRHRQAARGGGAHGRGDGADARGRGGADAGVRRARAGDRRTRSRRPPTSMRWACCSTCCSAAGIPPGPALRSPAELAQGDRRHGAAAALRRRRQTGPSRGRRARERGQARHHARQAAPPAAGRSRHHRRQGAEEEPAGALRLGRPRWPTTFAATSTTSRSAPGRTRWPTAPPSSCAATACPSPWPRWPSSRWSPGSWARSPRRSGRGGRQRSRRRSAGGPSTAFARSASSPTRCCSICTGRSRAFPAPPRHGSYC